MMSETSTVSLGWNQHLASKPGCHDDRWMSLFSGYPRESLADRTSHGDATHRDIACPRQPQRPTLAPKRNDAKPRSTGGSDSRFIPRVASLRDSARLKAVTAVSPA